MRLRLQKELSADKFLKQLMDIRNRKFTTKKIKKIKLSTEF